MTTVIPGNNHLYTASSLMSANGGIVIRTPTATSVDEFNFSVADFQTSAGITANAIYNGFTYSFTIQNHGTANLSNTVTGTGLTMSPATPTTIPPNGTRTFTIVQIAPSACTIEVLTTNINGLNDVNTDVGLYHGESLNYDTTDNTWKNGSQVPCWKDLIGPTNTRGSGSTIPPVSAYGDTLMWQTGFSSTNNTQYYFTYHIPHDYILGTDLFIHAHHSTTDPTETGVARYRIRATYASIGSVFPSATSNNDIFHTFSANSDKVHIVSEIQLSTPGGSNDMLDTNLIDTDGIILVRLLRSANGDMNNPDQLYLHEVDVHYQSYTAGTINKTAPFRT